MINTTGHSTPLAITSMQLIGTADQSCRSNQRSGQRGRKALFSFGPVTIEADAQDCQHHHNRGAVMASHL
jgi:hypothetical protein